MATFTFYGTSSHGYHTDNADGQLGTTLLIQGAGADGSYDNAKSLVVFDSTAIRNSLVGYTVTATTLNFTVNDVEGTNATIFIGTHNYTSLPATPSNSRMAFDRVRYVFSQSQTNQSVTGVNIGATIGQEFKDGVTTGIIFGPATFNAVDNGATILSTGESTATRRPYLVITATPSNVAPNAPALTSPGNNAVLDLANSTTTFTFTHSDPNGDPMASFQLRRRLTGSSTYEWWNVSTNNWQTTAINTAASGSNGSVVIPSGKFVNGNVYLWSVLTTDPGGLTSPWSAERTVYASTPPGATVTSPTGNVAVPRPTLRWDYSDTEGQAQYGWIAQVVDSTVYSAPGYNPDNYTSPLFSTSGTGTANSLVAPIDVVNHHTYRAYVKVSSSPLPTSALQFSSWAFSTFTVVIPPYAPTMVYPQNGSIADLAAGFTLDWSNSFYGPGSQSAFAIRRIASGGTYQWWNGLNWTSTTEVWLSGTQSQYAFRPTEIANGVTYTFSVAIRDDYSQTSPYASGATVTGSAQAQVTIISPQDTAITTRPLVQWSEFDPENDPQQTYHVRIISDTVYTGQGASWNPGTATAVWSSGETVDPSGLVRSVSVPTNLTNGSTYRAYVQVKTGGVYSGWTYSEFTVQLIGPATPTMQAVVDQEGAAIEITVQGRDSFLDVPTAGNFSGWEAENNATVTNQVFFASAHSSRITTLSATATGAMAARSTTLYPVYVGQIYTWAATISMATGTAGGGKQSYVTIEFLDASGTSLSTVVGNTIVDDSAQRSIVTASAPDNAVNARLHVAIIEPVPVGGVHTFFDPVFRPGSGGEWSPGGLVGLTKFSVNETTSNRLVRRGQNIEVPGTNQVVIVRDEEPEIGEPETYEITASTIYPGGAVLTSVPGVVGPLTWTSGWLWLSDPIRLGTARSFGPQSLGDITRPVRQGKFRPLGRADAVITTGVRGLREGSFKLVTWTREERDTFQNLVDNSGILLLRIPPDQGDEHGETIYIRVEGDAPESRPLASRTPHRTIEQAWVEQYRPLDLLEWFDEGN
jgi:hypothetical protein